MLLFNNVATRFLTHHNRSLDPVFAISIGVAAAATRINREEKGKGRSTAQSMDVLKRRWNLAWQGDNLEKKKPQEGE
jgi:hypothetical protein